MKTHLELATAAALEAGKLVVSMLGRSAITQKGTTYNLVTDADTASERLIAELITQNFPDSEILGEEDHAVKDLLAPKLWVIDPLDGTNNFAHEIPQFSISIAYAEFGKVLAGVVYDPSCNELFSAERGKGAWLNGKPISVSRNKTLSESMIATGFYYDRGDLLDNTIRAIYRLFKSNIQCVRRMGSAALDLSYVACGRFDAYYEYMLSPWDFAAGTLILEEAGGVWTDREGCNSGLQSKGILCSNGLIQEVFLKVVKYSTVAGERIGL
jgi:myo-inositol-1(or 4)-monophosphatase